MGERLAAGSVFALCLAVIVTAQKAPLPQFRTGVEVIQLDVTVLDKERRPVRGLTAAEFTILEDGKPRPVVAFDEVVVPSAEAPSAAWMRDIAPDVRTNDLRPEGRLIVIVMDDATLPPAPSFVESSKTIARRIVESMGPADLLAVVFTLNNRNTQDFTADRARLLAAIESFTYGHAFLPPGTPDAKNQDRNKLAELSLYHSYSVDVLARAAEALRAIEHARKTIFYIGIGAYLDTGAAATPVLVGELSPAVAERDAQLSLYRRMEDAFDQALKSNVNIYAIEAGGLGGTANFLESRGFSAIDPRQPGLYDPRVFREYLQTVSNNSGGYAVIDSNAPEQKVADIFRENGAYYLVGFQSAQPQADGKFHTLDVRVNRPGVTVMSRNGYFAPRPTPSAKRDATKAPSALVTAMSGFLPAGDISMRVTAAAFAIPGKREAALAIVAALRQPAPDRRETQTVELLTRAFDPQGHPRGSSRQTARLMLRPAGGDDAQFEVLSQIALKPGRYSLRVAGNNTSSGKSGSVYLDVDVPDFGKQALALSGVVIASNHPPQSAPRDALAALVPVVPTSLRDFQTEDEITAITRVYVGGKPPFAPVSIDARVLDASDRRVYERSSTIDPAQFDASRASDYRLDLPLSSFAPGSYVLTIAAKAAGTEVARHVRFAVRP